MKPVLAIVGRPNVGKSALFNRISGKQISLVFDRPGVTRDRITLDCKWQGRPFQLIDTGGIGLDDESGFEDAIQREVAVAMATASDIFLVVDGREGLNPLDVEVARRLRPTGLRVHVIVNKIDTAQTHGWEGEFQRLGYESIHAVSALHGLGVDALMGRISRGWPEEDELEKSQKQNPVRVAIVGRPNAGKSSMINALLNEERVIVSPIAGTTRDAVDVHFVRNDQAYCLVDTAGMRKKARISDPLESIMSGRSAHTINRADVCVLVVDAVLGIGVQEKKIAGLIQDAGKPCLILVNKWDLTEGAEVRRPEAISPKTTRRGGMTAQPLSFQEEYENAVRRELFFLSYAPVVFASALEKINVEGWIDTLERIGRNRRAEIPAGPLNRQIHRLYAGHNPPSKGNRPLKIYYVAQLKDAVCPTLAVFINDAQLWTTDYARYMEQHIREEFPLEGCPLVWQLRDKKGTAAAAGGKGRDRERGKGEDNDKDQGKGRGKGKSGRPRVEKLKPSRTKPGRSSKRPPKQKQAGPNKPVRWDRRSMPKKRDH
jgi:GTPase